jgi:hypothetical protein
MLAPLRENRARQAVVRPLSFPAPVEGWDTSTALAAMKSLRAVQLKNWFPQPGYLEIRRGWQRHARISGGSSTSIETVMAWRGTTSSKLFFVGGGVVYDGTASGNASSSLTGLSNSRLQHISMTTSAGHYLLFCNGADSMRAYNGSAWSTPSISGATSADFIQLCLHKKRVWAVLNESTDAYYLATDAIAGTATKFSLGANFDRGGYLLAMTTWTLDGGQGPDDYAVFISSEGQVAVYSGTDPASADTWALVGVYNIAKPIGRRCFTKYGTSPLILTEAGVLQLALSIGKDEASLRITSLTQNIASAINAAARSYSDNWGWELCVYPRGTRLIVNIPTAENDEAKQYVMNTLTGAWCEFDGHPANSWLVYNDNLYFGDNSGRLNRADYTGADDRSTIVAVGQTAYNAGGGAGVLKRYTMVQPLILTEGSTRVSVGISTDFVETTAISTPVGAVPTTALWDSAVWDTDVWGGQQVYVSDWTSSPALGRFASVKFTARTGVEAGVWSESVWGSTYWNVYAPELTLQVNGFVVLAEPGGFV